MRTSSICLNCAVAAGQHPNIFEMICDVKDKRERLDKIQERYQKSKADFAKDKTMLTSKLETTRKAIEAVKLSIENARKSKERERQMSESILKQLDTSTLNDGTNTFEQELSKCPQDIYTTQPVDLTTICECPDVHLYYEYCKVMFPVSPSPSSSHQTLESFRIEIYRRSVTEAMIIEAIHEHTHTHIHTHIDSPTICKSLEHAMTRVCVPVRVAALTCDCVIDSWRVCVCERVAVECVQVELMVECVQVVVYDRCSLECLEVECLMEGFSLVVYGMHWVEVEEIELMVEEFRVRVEESHAVQYMEIEVVIERAELQIENSQFIEFYELEVLLERANLSLEDPFKIEFCEISSLFEFYSFDLIFSFAISPLEIFITYDTYKFEIFTKIHTEPYESETIYENFYIEMVHDIVFEESLEFEAALDQASIEIFSRHFTKASFCLCIYEGTCFKPTHSRAYVTPHFMECTIDTHKFEEPKDEMEELNQLLNHRKKKRATAKLSSLIIPSDFQDSSPTPNAKDASPTHIQEDSENLSPTKRRRHLLQLDDMINKSIMSVKNKSPSLESDDTSYVDSFMKASGRGRRREANEVMQLKDMLKEEDGESEGYGMDTDDILGELMAGDTEINKFEHNSKIGIDEVNDQVKTFLNAGNGNKGSRGVFQPRRSYDYK